MNSDRLLCELLDDQMIRWPGESLDGYVIHQMATITKFIRCDSPDGYLNY